MPRITTYDEFRSERRQNATRRQARKAYNDLYLDCPGQWTLDGTNCTAVVLSSIEAVAQFANGAQGDMYLTIRKRSMWTRGGELEVTIIYSGSTSSTNTFSVNLRAEERDLGDSITGSHTLNVTDTPAGPATANDSLEHTFSERLTVTGSGEYLSFLIRRNSSDSNGGALRITGVKLRYLSRR